MGTNNHPLRIFTIVAVMLLVSWVFIHGSRAQVTFSKDWNAGKRTVDNAEFRSNMKSATAVCHLLINHIREMVSCGDDAEQAASPIF